MEGQKPIPFEISSKTFLRILVWSDITSEVCTGHSGQSITDSNASLRPEILQVFKANPQHHHTPPPYPPY